MHVGTDFLKLPPVTGQYWSLFQCSMLGTGGTCVVGMHLPVGAPVDEVLVLPLTLSLFLLRFAL